MDADKSSISVYRCSSAAKKPFIAAGRLPRDFGGECYPSIVSKKSNHHPSGPAAKDAPEVPETPVGEGAEAASDPPADPPVVIEKEREQWAAEKAELQDRMLRTQAEFQNLRRRNEEGKAGVCGIRELRGRP